MAVQIVERRIMARLRHQTFFTLVSLKQAIEVQASDTAIVIYNQGQRVVSHPRSYRQDSHTTCTEHMPQSHRAMSEWFSERFLKWAGSIGAETREVVRCILQEKRHEQQSLRRILALLSNTKIWA